MNAGKVTGSIRKKSHYRNFEKPVSLPMGSPINAP